MENKKKTNENNENLEEITNEQPEVPVQSEENSKKEEKSGKKPDKESEALKKELEEQKDKYIRLVAEYDNYRKRTQKEKSDAYTDAFTRAIVTFLPLIDNMERALEYEKDNEGIKAILKQLGDVLNSLDVKAIESDGKTFDPNLHNAIMHEEDENAGENVIIQTLQKGYMLNDKVIRHAMVKVVN